MLTGFGLALVAFGPLLVWPGSHSLFLLLARLLLLVLLVSGGLISGLLLTRSGLAVVAFGALLACAGPHSLFLLLARLLLLLILLLNSSLISGLLRFAGSPDSLCRGLLILGFFMPISLGLVIVVSIAFGPVHHLAVAVGRGRGPGAAHAGSSLLALLGRGLCGLDRVRLRWLLKGSLLIATAFFL